MGGSGRRLLKGDFGMANVLENLTVTGALSFQSGATMTTPDSSVTNAAVTATAAIDRSKLAQDSVQPFIVPFTDLRVWDAMATNLPATAANDDLALVGGTFGTAAPMVQAGDLKAAGATTRYARFLVRLPAEYVDDETVNIRVRGGMETTVADTTCTADIEAYLLDKDGALVGSPTDLCTTAATTINSLTAANIDFTLTDTNLVSGSIVDVRVAIACNDAATGTAVTPAIYSLELLADIKG